MNIVTLLSANELFHRFAQTKVAPRLAYKIMKFCKSVEIEEEFYNNRRNEIISTYAEKDENGYPIVEGDRVNIIKDKIAEANTAMLELNNMDVEAPNVKFTLDELEVFELSVADMFVLDEFIEN